MFTVIQIIESISLLQKIATSLQDNIPCCRLYLNVN